VSEWNVLTSTVSEGAKIMRNIRHNPRQAGFTLIELTVVIGIIAVLGMASDQTASLNVVFVPAVQSQPGVSVPAVQQCALNLAILDRAGTVLASSTEIVSPNQSRSLIYPPVGKDPTAVELHAVVAVPACPDNSTSCSEAAERAQQACRGLSAHIASSLEIIDNASGKTVVALPGMQISPLN
jgi:prepilin-type N-terminal cleavage/methylation domain-containing protein